MNQEFIAVMFHNSKNPRIVLEFINKNPSKLIPLLDFLFSMPTYGNDIWTACIWLMLQQSPLELSEYLKKKGVSSSTCGRVWKASKDMCYHCKGLFSDSFSPFSKKFEPKNKFWLGKKKDCEVDSTCAICVDCFEPEKHVGHEVRLVRAGGGCCDCGDSQAWNTNGFCSKHSAKEIDIKQVLPEKVIESGRTVLRRTLLWFVKNAQQSIYNKEEAPKFHAKLLATLKVFETLCNSFGDSFKKLLTLELIENSLHSSNLKKLSELEKEKDERREEGGEGRREESETVSPLEFLVLGDHLLHPVVQKTLHSLYFVMLGDMQFKTNFGFFFAKYYRKIFETYKDKKKRADSLIHFSVQILTVPSLFPLLCKPENSILDNLLQVLLETVKQCQIPSSLAPITGRLVLETDDTTWPTSLFFTLMTDFKYLITQKSVSHLLLFNAPTLRKFSTLLQLFQGSLLLKRKVGEHVMFDTTDALVKLFEFDAEFIARNVPLLLKGLEVEEKEEGGVVKAEVYGIDSFKPVKAEVCGIDSFKPILQQLLKSFEECSSKVGWEWQKKSKTSPKFLVYKPNEHLISPFLPLQRILSSLLSSFLLHFEKRQERLKGKVGEETIQTIFSGVEESLLHQFMQEVIQFKIFFSQTNSSLWVRNGAVVSTITASFSSKWMHQYCLDGDLFLLQVAPSLVGSETLLSNLIQNFGLSQWISQLSTEKKALKNPLLHASVIADFFRLVGSILMERDMCGFLSEEEKLERELIHHLIALGRVSFSKLSKNLNENFAKHKQLENILNKLADKNKGEDNQVTFTLKPEFYENYDPYFPHFSMEERQKAEENFLEHQKEKANSPSQKQETQTQPTYPPPKVLPILSSLSSGLFQLSQSLQLVQSICQVLFYYSSPFSHETVVKEALYLLHVCIQFAFLGKEKKHPFHLLDDIKQMKLKQHSTPFDLLQLLFQIRGDSTQKFHHRMIDSILNDLEKDEQLKQFVLEIRKEKLGNKGEESEEDKKEKARLKAKQRQEKMMKKMKQKQQKFVEKNKEEKEIEKEIEKEERKEENECVWCRDSTNDVQQNPLTFICNFIEGNTCEEEKDAFYHPNTHFHALQVATLEEKGKEELFPYTVSSSTNTITSPTNSLLEENAQLPEKKRAKHGKENENESGAKEEELKEGELTREEKERRDLELELMKNVDEKRNNKKEVSSLGRMYLRSCAHLLHLKCYQTFLSTTLNQQLTRPTIDGLSMEKGEFLCPLCKSVGSTLIPTIPASLLHTKSSFQPNKQHSALEFKVWKEKLSDKNASIKKQTAIDCHSEWSSAFDLFLQHSHFFSTSFWPHPKASVENCLSTVWNSVCSSFPTLYISKPIPLFPVLLYFECYGALFERKIN